MKERKDRNKGNRQPCEAAIHHSRFVRDDGTVMRHYADNEDHLTPKCLIKYKQAGLTKTLLYDPTNLIPSNQSCHTLKDLVTPVILNQAKRCGGLTYCTEEFMQMWQARLALINASSERSSR